MIENPAWQIIKDLPGNDIDLKYRGIWYPDGYPYELMQKMSHEERVEWGKTGPTRHNMVQKYAWAIPADVSIEWLAGWLKEHDILKVVEIGAGTGYWAWMLTQCGIDVNAYDLNPPSAGGNHWHCSDENATGVEWHPVKLGDARDLAEPENQTRALFLCWPPYDTSMGEEVLRAYQGNTVIYIGETCGGCNAGDGFFDLLDKGWEMAESGPLHQWWGLHDTMTVYVRKVKR